MRSTAAILLGCMMVSLSAAAFVESPGKRLDALEPRVTDLEGRVDALEEGQATGIGVLEDANGNVIGKVVGVSGSSPSVNIIFEHSGMVLNAWIYGHGGRGFATKGRVSYESDDCSDVEEWIEGGANGWKLRNRFFDSFLSPFIVKEGLRSDARKLYVPQDVTPIMKTFNSYYEGDSGVCRPLTESKEAVPAILLDADLNTTYPKPYSLILN